MSERSRFLKVTKARRSEIILMTIKRVLGARRALGHRESVIRSAAPIAERIYRTDLLAARAETQKL